MNYKSLFTKKRYFGLSAALLCFAFTSCKSLNVAIPEANTETPESYSSSNDTTNTAHVSWKEYFTDLYLTTLIDTALKNNQELNITLQEIEIARNEVRAKKGEYLPSVGLQAGAGLDKVGRYTRNGALEATTDIAPGKEFPEPLGDFMIGAMATWEVDIWHKLRNAKKSAVAKYLASVEGKNFMVTHLVAEIANTYYQLLALDNELEIVKQNIEIQENALRIVKMQKQSARVTELAVTRFEAQVLHTTGLQYSIQQEITELENEINFLLGRYPQPIARDSKSFIGSVPDTIYAGLPSQLLANRPDIMEAELELVAAKLDVKVAKAQFYPTFDISAGIGFQAFNPTYLIQSPQSLLYSLAGDLVAPLINRNGIKAAYYSANATQLQAVYNYERSILNAYIEVANQLAKIGNMEKSYDLKAKEVAALTESIRISNSLFTSARADYMEVLLTQRDALESRFELIEIKQQQMNAFVHMYQALGGGWN